MHLSDVAQHTGGQLLGKDISFTGCSIDSRKDNAGQLFIAINGERFDGHTFINDAIDKGAVAAMHDKPLEENIESSVIVKNVMNAIADLASHWRDKFNLPVIAVTGSNGKTTVKEMIFSILSGSSSVLSTKGNLNNHIGVPLTLFNIGNEHKYAVIEMGANQPGEISQLTNITKPTVALITSCAPSHLEGFGTVEGVANAKAEIFQGLNDQGTAIINADDDYAGLWEKQSCEKNQLRFSVHQVADIYADSISTSSETLNCHFKLHLPDATKSIQLNVPGKHNVHNAIAAASCCYAVGISIGQIKSGLEKFTPVKGRLQLIANISGLKIYDDSYNANPKSLGVALQTLSLDEGKLWLIMGDMGELGLNSDQLHKEAGHHAREAGFERLYAVGNGTRLTVSEFGEGGRHFSDISHLIETLKKEVTAGVSILVKGSRFMKMEKVTEALLEGR